MSYTESPATALLAVNCCVCGRALVDADSVNTGIGPTCRRTYGIDGLVSDDARAEANSIVYHVARNSVEIESALTRLEELGLDRLVARLRRRLAARVDVVIEAEGDYLVVAAPFRRDAVAAFRGIRGRRWCPERKVQLVPADRRAELWTTLRACYSGLRARGPRGVFTIA